MREEPRRGRAPGEEQDEQRRSPSAAQRDVWIMCSWLYLAVRRALSARRGGPCDWRAGGQPTRPSRGCSVEEQCPWAWPLLGGRSASPDAA